jgi:uncharacterized protein (TIGR02996 family)
MTEPDALYETLSRTPNDWATRAVLADWYEEQGQQPAADCLRWMVRRRKRPYRSGATFHWFNADCVNTGTDPESDVPGVLYRALRGREGFEKLFRDYDSLRGAEEDFHAAWARARDGGWDPEA